MENRVDYCCYWIGESLPTTYFLVPHLLVPT